MTCDVTAQHPDAQHLEYQDNIKSSLANKMADNQKSLIDWQVGRSTHERYAYMFDNQLCTDVLFEVGYEDEKTNHVAVRSYVLVS